MRGQSQRIWIGFRGAGIECAPATEQGAQSSQYRGSRERLRASEEDDAARRCMRAEIEERVAYRQKHAELLFRQGVRIQSIAQKVIRCFHMFRFDESLEGF